MAAVAGGLRGIEPEDEFEGMLAAQAMAAHHAAMECYRRAARSSQTPNLNTRLLGTAAMLSRTMGGALHKLEQRQDDPAPVAGPGAP